MNIFDVLTLIGGLCLFLFGMNLMGDALERSAGRKLEMMIGKLTTGKWAGLLTGLGVTAIIQSSSATTVMVVGFANSRLMTLKQAIHVIMGANIGTTVTAWILSLSGIEDGGMVLKLLKPSCADRYHPLDVCKEQPQEGYRNRSSWLCYLDVWYGNHDGRRFGA